MGTRGFVFLISAATRAPFISEIVENHGIDRIRRKNFKSLRGCSWQLRPCSRSLPELFCQCLGSSDYHRHRGGLSAAWPRRLPCADECSHPLCRQVGGGMYKETTLHSFEVHQKLATLFPLFASMCTAIHRSMTRNCARVFVAVVWSRCWRDFSALFRLLKSRSTRPGAIWECAN